MSEPQRITDGISFNRILTPTFLFDFFMDGDYIGVIRSGVNAHMESCADLFEEVCKLSERPKVIRIVMPSVLNLDVIARAHEAGRCAQTVLKNLALWQETLAKLAIKLAPPHMLDLRTTLEPHRYHAIFTEKAAVIGVPWHSEASITTSSFVIGQDSASVIAKLHKDFEVFFARCTPYKLGDAERLRKETAAKQIDDPILLSFGKSQQHVLEILLYVARAFPRTDGCGVTNADLHAKFGTDEADANRRLLEMEDAGMLKRINPRAARDRCYGRIITRYGKYLIEKYAHLGPG
jgi:hypothetical protein